MATSSKWVAESLDEVAAFFGVSRRTVASWSTEKDWPIAKPGKGKAARYDLPKIYKWIESRHEAEVDAATESDTDPELRRGRKLKADLTELDLRERVGELVHKDDAEMAIDAGLTAFLAQAQAIRDKLVLRFPEAEAEVWRDFDTLMAKTCESMGVACETPVLEIQGDC